jgi:hypothetical protein
MFEERRAVVQKMLREREPLCIIENWIDGLSEPEEHKDALWLFAWSEQPPATKPGSVDSARTARGRSSSWSGTSKD